MKIAILKGLAWAINYLAAHPTQAEAAFNWARGRFEKEQ